METQLIMVYYRDGYEMTTQIYQNIDGFWCNSTGHKVKDESEIYFSLGTELVETRKIMVPENLHYFGFDKKKVDPVKWDLVKIEKLCTLWIDKLIPTKNIVHSRTSYGLKHIMEDLHGYYVSNGESILVMILLGFRYKVVNDVNACFNLKHKSTSDWRAAYLWSELGYATRSRENFIKQRLEEIRQIEAANHSTGQPLYGHFHRQGDFNEKQK